MALSRTSIECLSRGYSPDLTTNRSIDRPCESPVYGNTMQDVSLIIL